jgi:integrase
MPNPEGWAAPDGAGIKYLSDEEVRRFFAAAEANPDSALRARDLCLFKLMLHFGLRCAEANLLQTSSVNFKVDPAQLHVVRVKEKHWRTDPKTGEKIHIEKARRSDHYPLSDSDTALIKAWLKLRAKFTKAKDGPLFVTIQGRPVTANYIYHITARYGAKAGIEGLYPHQLRHTCAIRMAIKGYSAYEIKERLGHASILSSEVYCNLRGPERQRMHLRANRAVEGDDDD